MDEIARLAEPLAGKRVVARLGDGVRRRRGGDQLHARAADGRRRARRRVADHPRRRRVLRRHEGDPQRAPGRPALADAERASRSSAATTRRTRRSSRPTTTTSSIVHDPQPAAMIDCVPGAGREVDLARAHRLLDAEPGGVRRAAAVDPALRRGDLPHARVRAERPTACRQVVIWPPAIDPLMPKNMALSPEDASYIVDQFGIDVERPLLTQVSRFDPWKDPLGVIDAYRAREAALPGRAARAGRLDGARRPGGLGLLQPHGRVRRRRPGHLHPLQPEQRRRGRGERVPGAFRAR